MWARIVRSFQFSFALTCVVALTGCGTDEPLQDEAIPFGPDATERELLVAFVGDSGLNSRAASVLRLIKAEGAAFLIHLGDFDYDDDPKGWNAQFDDNLGSDFPVFSVIGNHDQKTWEQDLNGGSGYRQYIEDRMNAVDGLECQGELGVQAACRYKGLFFVLSGVGTQEAKSGTDHVEFLNDSLDADDSIWSICAWHKNQSDLQIGKQDDEVGWPAYVGCMNRGGIIANGHSHTYSRSYTLSDIGNKAAAHGAMGEPNRVQVGAGRTFVAVNGLGGIGPDLYDPSHDDDTWWATAYALPHYRKDGKLVSQAIPSSGALFIRFGVNGNPRAAKGYFKNILEPSEIIDEFDIVAE